MKVSPQVFHASFAVVTLGVSAFVAFGPFRHRLPRVLTRFAKYSMAFKLAALATVTGVMLWHNLRDQGSATVRWVLTFLCVGFAVSAVRVIFLKAGKDSAPLGSGERGSAVGGSAVGGSAVGGSEKP